MDVNRVEITFNVSDRRGHFVKMGRDDFAVFDNKQAQKIIEFTAESELPLRLGLLLDASNSVRDRFRFIQESAADFVSGVLRPGYDQAMLISFDTAAEVTADFIGDPKRLLQAIHDLRPGGGTSLYEAIDLAAGRMADSAKRGPRCRFAMVVISDGEDNDSRVSRDQALEAVQRANAVLYAVSTNTGKFEVLGDRVLKYLAAETGGAALFPFRGDELRHSFETIAQELRHQYNILYRPDRLAADGRFHPVEIRLKAPKGFTVRARKGYYAPAARKATGRTWPARLCCAASCR